MSDTQKFFSVEELQAWLDAAKQARTDAELALDAFVSECASRRMSGDVTYVDELVMNHEEHRLTTNWLYEQGRAAAFEQLVMLAKSRSGTTEKA